MLKSVKAIKILLWLVPLAPILLSSALAFPYVSTKTIYVRLLIEAAAVLFLWLCLQGQIKIGDFKKQNWFLAILLALLGVEIVAAFLGQSPLASFFSDLERMWGIFTVGHLVLFYFLARIFFDQRDWDIFWLVSLGTSLAVSVYGIIQHWPDFFGIRLFDAGVSRITSTLGNPTYLAIYLLFSLAFAMIYFLKTRGRPIQYFYLAVLVVDSVAFLLTEIRGAYLGVVLGTGLALVLYIFLGQNKKLRLAGASLILAGILIGGLAWLNPQSAIVKQTPILKNLATISLSATTAQTRLISWNAAWQGIKERPMLGVGMENFNVVFNKYFQASYYTLAPTESYFDRAHNQYLNMLAESGIFSLLIYLLFPCLWAYYLFVGWRRGRFTLAEFLILTVLGVAYLVHIFFVFDDLHSLLFLMATLAFVEFRFWGGASHLEKTSRAPGGLKKAAILILMLLIVFSAWNFNVRVAQASRFYNTAYASSDFKEKITYFDRMLALKIVPAEDLVVGYLDYLRDLAGQFSQLDRQSDEAKVIANSIQEVGEALNNEVAKNPHDAFLLMKRGEWANFAFLFYNDKKYLTAAISDLQQAIILSPQRLQLFYVLSESYVMAGQPEQAIKAAQDALDLNTSVGSSYYYLGRAYLANNEVDKAYDYIMIKAIKEANYQVLSSKILMGLGQKYSDAGNYQRAAEIFEKILVLEKKNADVMAALTAIYIQLDRFDQALQMARQTAAADPSFAKEANLIIEMIQKGQYQKLKDLTR